MKIPWSSSSGGAAGSSGLHRCAVPPEDDGVLIVDAGFTLIEAMVALVVLAVASAGLIRATEAHIDLIGGLQARTVAQWVAENRLVELGLVPGPPPVGEQSVRMLGQAWRVKVDSKPSQDPDLAMVDVSVGEPSAATPLVTLTGFVDIKGPTP